MMDDEKKTAGEESPKATADAEVQKTSTEKKEKNVGAKAKAESAAQDTNTNGSVNAEQKAPKRKKTASKEADPSAEKAEEDPEDEQIDAPSIDSLLYDGDDGVITDKEDDDHHSSFEEFLADYKAVIKKSLAMARSASRSASTETSEKKQDAAEEENVQIAEINDETPVSEDSAEEQEAAISDTESPQADESSYEADAQIEMELDDKSAPETETDEVSKARKYDPEKPRAIDSVFDFVELFIFTLAAVLIITTFFFKHTIVDGPSMMNTLHDGEHLIISDLFYTPDRGDIVVFADYSAGQKTPYVKRVIAIAGDTVSVTSQGKVTVNGEPLDEDYVFIDGDFPAGYYGKECIVPEGEVFVLGDHRNNSYDSASFPNTTIKVDSILGKVLFRIYPFDKFGTVD